MLEVSDNFDNFNEIEALDDANDPGGFITQHELLRHLRGQGYGISEDQLRRWHKEDCLPRPHTIHPIGIWGTVSRYPAHAVPQALALCRLRAKKRYSFDELRVLLWVQGFRIPPERVQSSLQSLMEHMRDELYQRARMNWRDTLAVAEQLTSQALPALARSALGRLIKRRLKPTDWASYLTLQFQLLAGGIPAFEAGDEHITEAGEALDKPLAQVMIDAHALQRAQTDRLGEATPWLPQNIAPTLLDLARRRVLSLRYMLATIERATPRQLAQALIDRQVIFIELPELVRGMEAIFGEDAFGFGMFRALTNLIPPDDAIFQALQIVGMLTVRRSGDGPALDQISAAVRPATQAFTRYEALIAALKQELPTYAAELEACLAPIVDGDGDFTPAFQARLRRFQELADRHCDELRAFRERHLEFSEV